MDTHLLSLYQYMQFYRWTFLEIIHVRHMEMSRTVKKLLTETLCIQQLDVQGNAKLA